MQQNRKYILFLLSGAVVLWSIGADDVNLNDPAALNGFDFNVSGIPHLGVLTGFCL